MPLELELHAVPHLKGSSIVQTYLVGKSMAVLLYIEKLISKVPILLHTEQFARIFFRLSVPFPLFMSICSLFSI